MFEFIRDNADFLICVLLLTNALCCYYIMKLSSDVYDCKQELLSFIDYFNKQFAVEVSDELHEQKTEAREMFMTVWEYYYVLLAVNGFIKVDPKTFITDGINDIAIKLPKIHDIMRLPEGKDQSTVFKAWKKHYESKNQTSEEIFQKYHPDKDIL